MIIKILLMVAVLGLFVLLLRSQGSARSSAVAKIGICVLLLFAGYAVLRPDDVTWVAERIGVGRGTDLLLYAFVVGFGFFAVVIYLRFKELEQKYTTLARHLALLEADRPVGRRPAAEPSRDGAEVEFPLSAHRGSGEVSPDSHRGSGEVSPDSRAEEIVHSRHTDPKTSTFGRAGEDDPRGTGSYG